MGKKRKLRIRLDKKDTAENFGKTEFESLDIRMNLNPVNVISEDGIRQCNNLAVNPALKVICRKDVKETSKITPSFLDIFKTGRNSYGITRDELNCPEEKMIQRASSKCQKNFKGEELDFCNNGILKAYKKKQEKEHERRFGS